MATKVIKATLRFKRGTAAEWTTVNPVLKLGEPGFVSDLNRLKVGNGVDEWNELPYLIGGSGATVDVDGQSIEFYVKEDVPAIRIRDFDTAETGDIPIKDAANKIQWINLVDTIEEIAYTKEETDTKLATKQDKLTAGANVTIDSNNVISAIPGSITESEIREICI